MGVGKWVEVGYVRMLVWEESGISLDLIICSHCFSQRVHVEAEAFVRIVMLKRRFALSVGHFNLPTLLRFSRFS